MRGLIRILNVSALVLVLVICAFLLDRTLNPNKFGRHSVQQASAESTETKDEVVNINDVLPTVESSEGGGMNKTSDMASSDYRQVSGSGTLVDNSSSKNTAGQPASQNYDFKEEMYPYRAMLSAAQKKVYDQIYENANSQKADIVLCEKLNQEDTKNVMTAVYNDHPELFWLNTDYSYAYTGGGTVVSVTLQFNETKDDLMTSRSKFLDAAGNIINGASGLSSDLEKEKYVYKALENLVEYDEKADMNQSAYSALVNKKSVCAGYSRAFQYIMMQLNIPCYFCSGYANGGPHAWNIVKIDGKFYNADLSWDDSLGEASKSISYTYFNLTDVQISIDHTRRDMSVKLVKCN